MKIVVEFYPAPSVKEMVENKKAEIIEKIEKVFEELKFAPWEFSVYLTWEK